MMYKVLHIENFYSVCDSISSRNNINVHPDRITSVNGQPTKVEDNLNVMKSPPKVNSWTMIHFFLKGNYFMKEIISNDSNTLYGRTKHLNELKVQMAPCISNKNFVNEK